MIKKIFVSSLTIVFVCCTKTDSKQIMAVDGGQDNITFSDGRRPSVVLDSNKSGTLDYLNWDIDGDGIPNLIDSDPYDATVGSVDLNKNGIPDSIDFSILDPQNLEKSEIQIDIFRNHGIYVAEDRAELTLEELKNIQHWLDTKVFSNLSGNLKVILKRKSEGTFSAERGLYWGPWKSIILYPTAHFQETLVHELMHAFAYNQPELVQSWAKNLGWFQEQTKVGIKLINGKSYSWTDFDFQQNGQDLIQQIEKENSDDGLLSNFPSSYSFKNRDEHFAEAGAATLIIQNEMPSSYFSLESFKNSQAFATMKMILGPNR